MLFFLIFHYRDGLRYFFQDLYETIFYNEQPKEVTVHDIRAIEILDKHDEHLFGFDVSHYQSRIKTKQMFIVFVQNFEDRKSTRLNSSHVRISYAVFCLKKKNN